MSDFGPPIIQSVKEIFPEETHLKCTYHFHKLLKEKLSKKFFIIQCLAPSAIPEEFKNYFEVDVFLNKNRTNKFSPIRVVKYDICILMKLPTKSLFDIYLEIITPFWRK